MEAAGHRSVRRTILSIVAMLVVIPLTIWFGCERLGDKKYYFISLLIIIEVMIPFFVSFEGRKPKVRDIVILAVMCALAVTGRAAFFMLPNFSPTMAIVIISGVAFGCEGGFVVGAMSMFVSNFLMGPQVEKYHYEGGISMWTRAELKSKAKFSFKRNYWKSVLISLILALLVGGGSSGSSISSAVSNNLIGSSDSSVTDDYSNDDSSLYDGNDFYDDTYDGNVEDDIDDLNSMADNTAGMMAIGIFLIVFIMMFVVLMAVVILLDVFIFNPLEVGCKKYYLRNLNEPAQVGNIGYAFDNNYKNITKTMFFRDLFTVLWTLLFIIPGIVKSYEYQMIPYLLADNPQMTKEQAFEESKRMMQGQKWKAFVLDLSFIGWNILSALTLGILGIFYVQPYMDATHAALYEALRYGMPYNNAQYGFYNGMPQQQAPNGFTNNVPNSIVEENPNNQYQ